MNSENKKIAKECSSNSNNAKIPHFNRRRSFEQGKDKSKNSDRDPKERAIKCGMLFSTEFVEN